MQAIDSQASHLRQFLVYSNIHIPFLAFVLIISSSVFLAVEISFPLAIVASAGAFLIYQVDRVWLLSPEDLINQPTRVEWYHKHLLFKYVSTFLAIGTGCVGMFFLHVETLGSGFLLGFLGLIYLLPYGGCIKRLKGHWLAKPAFIGFCWSYGGVILPAIEGGVVVHEMVWLFFIYRYLLIAANVLLADLPDRRGDECSDLVTLAVFLSEEKIIQIVSGLSVLTFIVGLIHGVVYHWPLVLFIDLGGAVLLTILAYVSFRMDLSDSHFLLSYVNDLVIGWPVVSLTIYYAMDVCL